MENEKNPGKKKETKSNCEDNAEQWEYVTTGGAVLATCETTTTRGRSWWVCEPQSFYIFTPIMISLSHTSLLKTEPCYESEAGFFTPSHDQWEIVFS